MQKNNFVDGTRCAGKLDLCFCPRIVFRDNRPIRNHQLIRLTPVNEQVNVSKELSVVFKEFVISNSFGVITAAIQSNVDREDYLLIASLLASVIRRR